MLGHELVKGFRFNEVVCSTKILASELNIIRD